MHRFLVVNKFFANITLQSIVYLKCAKFKLVLAFLSDPSPIIGSACHSLTHSLPNCCLVNFIDVTLACEDANSKLFDVVTVADEDRVGNSLLQIWKLRFGQKAKLLFRL